MIMDVEKTENLSDQKVKVLYFVDRMLRGGIQTFVLENMRHMDRTKIQIDYLLLDDGVHYELEDVLCAEGAAVYKLKGIWLRTPKDYLSYQRALKRFFLQHHDYDVVHMHSSSKNWLVLYYAKKYGIPTRIAHSHNIGFQTSSKVQLIVANAFKPLLKKYATDYFACSEKAGKWLFGNAPVTVVHNAVDLQRFKQDERRGETIRKRYGLGEAFVVGHVGRFTRQKNHGFLLEIFAELVKERSNSTLFLVGEGELREKTEEQAKKLEIADKVVFAGFHSNVEDFLSAMDIVVFPSSYEGLGLGLIEAQANGLPCFASQGTVPQEAKVSDQLEFIPLSIPPKEWARKILVSDKKRKDVRTQIAENGYRIEDTARFLQEFYLQRKIRGS